MISPQARFAAPLVAPSHWLFKHFKHARTVPFSQIRFVTSHPRYMSPGVVDAVAASARICPAFHVPFQSGDDEVSVCVCVCVCVCV